ncbi:MAG: hypothetical protein OXF02_04040 [Simkaniaceae bacterium]|nr:hypothetical protein [Simkaniaceae bacterium]
MAGYFATGAHHISSKTRSSVRPDRAMPEGLIGPGEGEEDFVKRLDVQRKLCEESAFHSVARYPEAVRLIRKRFLVSPLLIPVRKLRSGVSSRRMLPWEGAISWVTARGAWVGLRTNLPRGYSEKELIAHEIVHALRASFDQPYFEEILAYGTSESRVRRFLGPLFSSPKDPYLFLFICSLAFLSVAIPSIFMLCKMGLLLYKQKMFARAKKQVFALFPGVPPEALLIRMTDAEIKRFARCDGIALREYVMSKGGSFRWRELMKRIGEGEGCMDEKSKNG